MYYATSIQSFIQNLYNHFGTGTADRIYLLLLWFCPILRGGLLVLINWDGRPMLTKEAPLHSYNVYFFGHHLENLTIWLEQINPLKSRNYHKHGVVDSQCYLLKIVGLRIQSLYILIKFLIFFFATFLFISFCLSQDIITL